MAESQAVDTLYTIFKAIAQAGGVAAGAGGGYYTTTWIVNDIVAIGLKLGVYTNPVVLSYVGAITIGAGAFYMISKAFLKFKLA